MCWLDYPQLKPANKLDNNYNLLITLKERERERERERETLTVFLANLSSAFPCVSKILALAFKRSFRSMPSLRGMAPTRMATSMFLKAASGSAVATVSVQWNRINIGMGRNGNLLAMSGHSLEVP